MEKVTVNVNRSEGMREKWKDPTFKEKMRLLSVNRWKNPDYRSKMTIAIHDSNLKHKKAQCLQAKERWKNKDYRAHIIKCLIKTNTGRKLSEEHKKKMGKITKKRNLKLWANPEWREKRLKDIRTNPNYKTSRHFKKGHVMSQEIKAKISKTMKGKPKSKEHNIKTSEALKQYYSIVENKERLFKQLNVRPTKPEKAVMKILKSILPHEYKYVGDGKVVIGGLCPDFINCNGQKKVIEVFGRIFHDQSRTPFKGKIKYYHTEFGRAECFRKYGFETLILWDDELENEEIVSNKILTFNGGVHSL